ncbi:family 78 glycoside hydrolase catalytic domain [Arachidicoccus rhizosphaerae]|nr:family 78 glycoside hydrolase catalytic domain [Arachidicoccus rhizosphaerae]
MSQRERSETLIAVNPKLLQGTWPGHWIHMNEQQADPRAYGVYHFRKAVNLATLPSHYIIHVSADNRYRLYINGHWIGDGPARGNLTHWAFGSYDLAPYLKLGKNVLAAEVWNMGTYAPVAQISNETGFLVQQDNMDQGNLDNFNTGPSWKVMHDTAYHPTALNTGEVLHSYFVSGPGDRVEGALYPWGWEAIDYNDSDWLSATNIAAPVAPAGYGTDNRWTLVPRSIPQMQHQMEPVGKIRRVESENEIAEKTLKDLEQSFMSDFNAGKALKIPAHQKLNILIDQGYETVGYPELTVSGGKGAIIKLTYTEALLDSTNQKGNRDSIEGKTVKGLFDEYLPDGGEKRVFRPLWIRTFRYVLLSIETSEMPVSIESFKNTFAAYPLKRSAKFNSSDSSLTKIWDVGWRTARLCAGETYFDCPYYEQLQYEADTRIQALITLYNSRDDRLVRKAINDFYLSLTPEGLTEGRYPSNRFQVIPPFSLWWVTMLHDYWMLRPDQNFVKNYLAGASQVLSWFENRIDSSTGMLGPLNWWNFVDWNPAFKNGVPAGVSEGNSSVITLQYALTLQQAANLFAGFNQYKKSEHYAALANKLAQATYKSCFDEQRGEMADTRDKNQFSQHASILGVLTNAIPVEKQKEVMEQILKDTTLSQATFYYRFYLTRAMVKAGLGDKYYESLTPWLDMLKIGLTTFAEKPEPTRSDCHGWSTSPAYDFLATILGITPSAPGFSKVRIEPHLGDLRSANGAMDVPAGQITVGLERREAVAGNGSSGLNAKITLPDGLTGEFIWAGKSYALKPGSQTLTIR